MRARSTAIALALILAGTALTTALPGASHQASAQNSGHQATDTHVIGANGTHINITVFKPASASATDPVPVVLHGHGWSGSRDTNVSAFSYLLDAGYGVVSIDQRGHGDSGGQAHVMHPDYEVKDIQAVIDHTATLPWVVIDDASTDDPRIGAIGGSYGGGYQLQTALHDDRLDALVPEITWNDLPYALAPNGVIKTTWNDILYAAGVAFVDMPDFIHQSFAWGTATNEFPDGSAPGEPNIEKRFDESSPFSHADHGHTIEAPTLLIQGMPDMLFNLNQALWNYHQINDTDTEVNLVTHLSGHVINTDGTLGIAPPAVGIQPADGGEPCGDEEDLQLAWFGEHLKDGADDGLPSVSMALDDGRCVSGALVRDLTLQEPSDGAAFNLTGPVPVGQPSPTTTGYVEARDVQFGSPVGTVDASLGASVESPQRVEVLSANQTRLLTGVPHLAGNITVAGADAIVHLSLVVEDASGATRTLDAQVTPLRQAGPVVQEPFGLELGGVATELGPGDTLYLQLSTNDLQYYANGERLPGTALLENLTLDLPIEAV